MDPTVSRFSGLFESSFSQNSPGAAASAAAAAAPASVASAAAAVFSLRSQGKYSPYSSFEKDIRKIDHSVSPEFNAMREGFSPFQISFVDVEFSQDEIMETRARSNAIYCAPLSEFEPGAPESDEQAAFGYINSQAQAYKSYEPGSQSDISARCGLNLGEDHQAFVTKALHEIKKDRLAKATLQTALRNMVKKFSDYGLNKPFKIDYELKNEDGKYIYKKLAKDNFSFAFSSKIKFTLISGSFPILTYSVTVSSTEANPSDHLDPRPALAGLLSFARTICAIVNAEKDEQGHYITDVFADPINAADYEHLLATENLKTNYHTVNDIIVTAEGITSQDVTLKYSHVKKMKSLDAQQLGFPLKHYEDDTGLIVFHAEEDSFSFKKAESKGLTLRQYIDLLDRSIENIEKKLAYLKMHFQFMRDHLENAIQNNEELFLNVSTLGSEARMALVSYFNMNAMVRELHEIEKAFILLQNQLGDESSPEFERYQVLLKDRSVGDLFSTLGDVLRKKTYRIQLALHERQVELKKIKKEIQSKCKK
jgi:hypothetical protein